MTATRTRTDAGLATALRISVSRLARRLRAQRAASGMTEAVLSETQLAALSALEVHHAMTPGELAEHEKVQPPSMTRVIAVLTERDLVAKSPHPTDRRQVLLNVTDEGRAVVHRVRRRKDAWLDQRLAELTAAERATLRAAVPILEKLSQSLPARSFGGEDLAGPSQPAESRLRTRNRSRGHERAAASSRARHTAAGRWPQVDCGPGEDGPLSTTSPGSRPAPRRAR
jgi:DNA-binding MarR family transcriptional regulator